MKKFRRIASVMLAFATASTSCIGTLPVHAAEYYYNYTDTGSEYTDSYSDTGYEDGYTESYSDGYVDDSQVYTDVYDYGSGYAESEEPVYESNEVTEAAEEPAAECRTLTDGNVTVSGMLPSDVTMEAIDSRELYSWIAEDGERVLFAYDIVFKQDGLFYTPGDGDLEYTIAADGYVPSEQKNSHVYHVNGDTKTEVTDVSYMDDTAFTSENDGVFVCIAGKPAGKVVKTVKRSAMAAGPRKAASNTVTKYSHTPNIDDAGNASGIYADNLSTNDVVTIPGASSLHVKLYYSTESTSYDWVCVWEGKHSDYKAADSKYYRSSKLGNTTGKIGNGRKETKADATVLEGDISGDTVTFGFRSDRSQGYYGYYAVITATTTGTGTGTTTTGTVIASGVSNSVSWKITSDGVLDIYPTNGISGTFQHNEVGGKSYNSRMQGYYPMRPWPANKDNYIKSVKVEPGVGFKQNQVADYLFSELKNCTSMDLSGLNTSGVSTMEEMFSYCNSLTTLNLSNFDTSNCSNIAGMFLQCKKLESINLTSFNTKKCTSLNNLFQNCENLKSVNVSSFDTSNCTSMQYTFSNCNSITSLNLKNFDTGKVGNVSDMFSYCTNLKTILVSDKFKIRNYSITDKNMFLRCDNLVGGNGTTYNSNYDNRKYARIDASGTPGYFTGPTYPTLTLSATNGTIDYPTTKIITYTYNGDGNISASSSDTSIATVSVNQANKQILIQPQQVNNATAIITVTSSATDRYEAATATYNATVMNNLVATGTSNSVTWKITTDGLLRIYPTNGVSGKFAADAFGGSPWAPWGSYYKKYTSIKVEKGVGFLGTSAKEMFCPAYWLTSCDISGLDTTGVQDFSHMLDHVKCKGPIVGLENLNTSSATTMEDMFYDSHMYMDHDLDLSKWNVSNVTNMKGMFSGGFKVYNPSTDKDIGLNLSGWNVKKVTDMSHMFSCAYITSLKGLKTWNTQNVTTMQYMFAATASANDDLIKDIADWNTQNVTTMQGIFQIQNDNKNLKHIKLNWNTAKAYVGDMFQVASGSSSIEDIDISSFDTTYGTYRLFYSLNNIKKIRTGSKFKNDFSYNSATLPVTMIKDGTTVCKSGTALDSGAHEYTLAGIGYDGNGADNSDAMSGYTHNYTGQTLPVSYTLAYNQYRKAGYTFIGWKDSVTGSTYADHATVQFSDNKAHILSAQWKPNTATLHFNGNSGTPTGIAAASNNNVTVSYGSTDNSTNATATRQGYKFKGYYTASSGGTQVYNEYGNGTTGTGYWEPFYQYRSWAWTGNNGSTIQLYAQWEKAKTYTIKFNANGGAGTMADQISLCGAETELTPNSFNKSGFSFTGWNSKADGSGTAYANSAKVTDLAAANQTVTLYAQWKANTYTIRFNANGGSGTMADEAMTYGTAKILTANAFTKDGYNFASWNTAANGSGTSYSDKQSVNNLTNAANGIITLYAQWESKTYTIHFDGNGSTGGSMADQQLLYGGDPQALARNTFTRKGYIFTGWTRENQLDSGITDLTNWNDLHSDTHTPVITTTPTNFSISKTGGGWETICSNAIPVTAGKTYKLSFNYKVNTAYEYLGGHQFGLVVESKAQPAGSEPVNVIGQQVFPTTVTEDTPGEVIFTPSTSQVYLSLNGGCIANELENLSFDITNLSLAEYYTDGESVQDLTENGTVNLYAQWKMNDYFVHIPAEISYSEMPVGIVDKTKEFDVEVTGEYSGKVWVKLDTAANLTNGSDTLTVTSRSGETPLEFAQPGTQKDSITISGITTKAATYSGELRYVFGNVYDE